VGAAAGFGLVILQLGAGLPPSFQIGLLVAGIDLSAELTATLVGFAVLGVYLGLRKPLRGSP